MMASKFMPSPNAMTSKDITTPNPLSSPTLLKRMMEMPNPDTSTSSTSTMDTSTHDTDADSICTIDTVSGTMSCPAEVLLSFRRFLEERRVVHGMGMGMEDHEGMQGGAETDMGMGMGMGMGMDM